LTYWHLWAKTGADGRWHGLPYHLLDVAAAAEVLWDRLPSTARTLPAQVFDSQTTAMRTCVFLAAAHDIGKANCHFQAKSSAQHARLSELGVALPQSSPNDNPRHGQATGAHLHPWLADRWRWTNLAAETVALAVGGHHGSFSENTHRTRLTVDCAPWACIGQALLDALSDVLAAEPPTEPKSLNPFLGWLSGLVSVADWLGSHESMTVWQTGERPLADYLREARCRARRLLDELHWQAPPATTMLPIAELVPTGTRPNALQQLAVELGPASSLAIVEAPTGEGKTEAAFALAEPARSCGAGVYFALPTMATANGLFGRVEAYLRKATRDADLETRLLHSQAWLFRDRTQTAKNPGDEGDDQERQAHDWFAGSKRGLLAPFGVGTIDQGLIAALRARHGFVRLFALAGKTVIIDEVHAYDVYMADLIGVLLGWLSALGCRVMLLSATLPKARRNAMLRAWGVKGELPTGQYPCVTYVSAEGRVLARGFDVQPRKPLTVEAIQAGDGESWEQGATRLLQLVRTRGGLGAMVLNTVGHAQYAYDWLQRQELGGVHVDLFHARFTAQDRDAIEKRVLARFGRNGARRQPSLLVATQVIEQSLDLDFDHMVSALAPIDLLIQRAGRLHRHRRRADGGLREDGADERSNPVLHVLMPPLDADDVPNIEDPVYGHDVLLRTLERLRSNPQIARPSDVADAVEAVYAEGDRAASMSAWEQQLKDLEARTAHKTQLQRRQAERATIGAVDDVDALIVEEPLDLDENDERHGSQLYARTRLEDRPSITVALLREHAGRLMTIHGAEPASLRDAMLACVRISPPYPLWTALLSIDPLSAWAGKGSLSQARPLILADGHVQIAGYEIRYDARRGLDWRRTHAVN
jgi:CRISPR-associated endonuclease/helicase Cas3